MDTDELDTLRLVGLALPGDERALVGRAADELARLQARSLAANELARRARAYLRGASVDTVDWRQARERELREAVEAFGFPLYENNRQPQ